MRYSLLSLLFLCAMLPMGVAVWAADAPNPPAVILSATDYRGQIGPLSEFSLKDDGSWTYTVKKGGKNVEATNGKLTADESKTLMAFVDGLELQKHTRQRNVEDASMISVSMGKAEYIDLAPEIASKVLNKIKEVTERKEIK